MKIRGPTDSFAASSHAAACSLSNEDCGESTCCGLLSVYSRSEWVGGGGGGGKAYIVSC